MLTKKGERGAPPKAIPFIPWIYFLPRGKREGKGKKTPPLFPISKEKKKGKEKKEEKEKKKREVFETAPLLHHVRLPTAAQLMPEKKRKRRRKKERKGETPTFR